MSLNLSTIVWESARAFLSFNVCRVAPLRRQREVSHAPFHQVGPAVARHWNLSFPPNHQEPVQPKVPSGSQVSRPRRCRAAVHLQVELVLTRRVTLIFINFRGIFGDWWYWDWYHIILYQSPPVTIPSSTIFYTIYVQVEYQ